MLRGALRTEEAFLTSIFFESTGPKSAFFTQQTGGAPSTLPLSLTNIKTAYSQMMAYTDSEGDPIVSQPAYLMCGPATAIEAMTILNSIQVNHTVPAPDTGSGTAEPHGSTNVLKGMLTLLINPWIPIISSSAKNSWALFTDPSIVPAGEFGTLAGYDVPQVKPLHGDAEDRDVLSWRVKMVMGSTTIDKRAVWGSTGAG